jgi:dissimilatory sulfite reductase (desulfoviridin) alpha/beta subunit
MIDDWARMVHLGNHPEVALCIGCGHWASKQAWAIEDRSRTGLAVRIRGHVRRARQTVIRRGWQRNPILGRGLRWLGRFIP